MLKDVDCKYWESNSVPSRTPWTLHFSALLRLHSYPVVLKGISPDSLLGHRERFRDLFTRYVLLVEFTPLSPMYVFVGRGQTLKVDLKSMWSFVASNLTGANDICTCFI